MPDKKTQYILDYKLSHYKRVPLDMKNEDYEELRTAASAVGEKPAVYIKKAIKRRIESGT